MCNQPYNIGLVACDAGKRSSLHDAIELYHFTAAERSYLGSVVQWNRKVV